MIACLTSGVEDTMTVLCKIRVILMERNDPRCLDKLCKDEIISLFLKYLGRYNDPDLQFEAIWLVTNITAGDDVHTDAVVRNGGVQALMHMLHHSDYKVNSQALMALGNIATCSTAYRDELVNRNILRHLKDFLESSSLDAIKHAIWIVANIARPPTPEFSKLKVIIPSIFRALRVQNQRVQIDALWALSSISDSADANYLDCILEQNRAPQMIVQFLLNPNLEILNAALHVAGNILSGNNNQTSLMIEAGIAETFSSLLQMNRPRITKQTCWAIANMCAGTIQQVGRAIEANIFPQLISYVHRGTYDIKVEALWGIVNGLLHGSPHHVDQLVGFGALEAVCEMLDTPDVVCLSLALDGISNVLKTGKRVAIETDSQNEYITRIEQCNGVSSIRKLQHHTHQDISSKAESIIDNFFSSPQESFNGGNMFSELQNPDYQFSFGN